MTRNEEKALANAIGALKPGCILPNHVFSKTWQRYAFGGTDCFLTGALADAVSAFLLAEDDDCACLVNLDRSDLESDKYASFFFDKSTDVGAFMKHLESGGSESWLYAPERYVCASSSNAWCIYSERMNEITVIALESAEEGFNSALDILGAGSLASVSDPNSRLFQEPFPDLIPEWRDGLAANYPA